MRFCTVLLFLVFAGCGTLVVDVTAYPNANSEPTPGFYNDSQKWQRVATRVGRSQQLSRAEVLSGSSRFSADVIRGRLAADTGYRSWVCRQVRQYDVLVVRCARHHKLQRYLPLNEVRMFNLQLQPLLRYGAAPVYVDWGWR